MAQESIDKAATIQFSDSVHEAAQQIRARLRGSVEVKPMSGDVFAYDGLGSIEAAETNGRFVPVVFSDANHTRRKISRRRFVLTLPIDAADVRGILISPQNLYAKACARAMERVFDRIVVDAQFASVYTGRDFETTVTAANDGVSTVTATAGLTYEKLLEASKNFIDAEVGNDMPERVILGIAGGEHVNLMSEIELVSGDFSRQYAVDQGRITRAAGFEVVLFGGGSTVARPILPVSGGQRTCFAMSSRAMCVGMSKEMSLTVDKRTDLVETTQVQIIFHLGAVRTEGVLIQKVVTTS